MRQKSNNVTRSYNLTPMSKMRYKDIEKKARYFVADTIIKGSAEHFNQFKVLWTPGIAMRNKFPADIFKEDIVSSFRTRMIINENGDDLTIDIAFDHAEFPDKRPKKIKPEDTYVDCGFIHIHEMKLVVGLRIDLYDLSFDVDETFLQTDQEFETSVEELDSLKNYLNHAVKLAKKYLHIWYCLQLANEPSIKNAFSPIFVLTLEDKVPRELLIKQGSTNRIKICKNIWLTDKNSIVNVVYNNTAYLTPGNDSKKLWWTRGFWSKGGMKYEHGVWKGSLYQKLVYASRNWKN